MNYPPCKNPNCKSYGKPHPNCRCYAKGGSVSQYCFGPHKSGCEYYADGGEVSPEQEAPINPAAVMGHAAMQYGLLGLLKDVGRAKLAEPEKHAKTLHQAKNHHSLRTNPTGTPAEKNMGSKMADHIMDKNHDGAADMMHGHPMVGSPNKKILPEIMKQMGPAILGKDPNPAALRGSIDYLSNAVKGHDALELHSKKLFGKQKSEDQIEADKNSREALKKHLEALQDNPNEMLDIGGSLGHYLPDHATQLGVMAPGAITYLSSLKPTQSRVNPIDELTPPDKGELAKYDRQIDIAQKPQMIFQHAKDGTLLPQDITTVQTLYPALYQSMTDLVGEQLIEAKNNNVEIPYREKQALGLLLGQPLDMTMSPMGMQAIIKSQGQQQAQNQMSKKSGPDNVTAVEMRAIEKNDELGETSLEARQIHRNSR